MSKKMIFHIPFEIDVNHVSGTFIRPIKMMDAFRENGYEVFEIIGNVSARKEKIKEITKMIDSGVQFDFMYAECSTEPTLLTESHHLPLNPFVDFNFFKKIKAANIPIGLFYRDVYWNFPFYGEGMPNWKKSFAKFFYKYDLKQYNNYVSVLFLPSIKMLNSIPLKMKPKIEALPPAALFDVEESQNNNGNAVNGIRILYVGGVGLLYRMQIMFEAVKANPDIRLTVCCREEEWKNNRNQYQEFLNVPNIEIVHKKGKELKQLFENHNLVSAVFEPSDYRSFAMPLKLFEYLQNFKPIISTKYNAVASFVEENDIGWTVNYDFDEINDLFEKLRENNALVKEKSNNMKAIIGHHTWKNRARTAAKILSNIQ